MSWAQVGAQALFQTLQSQGYNTELGIEWGTRQNPETRKEILVIAKIGTGKKADKDGKIKEGKEFELGIIL